MSKSLRFVGLDVHKDSVMIAVVEAGRELAYMHGEIANDRRISCFGTAVVGAVAVGGRNT
ncbi:MAG: hypothetical protein K8R46_07375 [Pirellulales bacterium]|nr:hypothetical protein [Pirellulales bacterium]